MRALAVLIAARQELCHRSDPKSEERSAADLSANAVDFPPRPGSCLHGRVRFDSRTGRRTHRLARNLAGRGLSRPCAASAWPRAGTYWRLPTLLWLSASDHALHAICWGGLFLGAVTFRRDLARVCARIALALLSLDRRWPDRFFWVISGTALLLEAGLLAVLMAPWQFGWAAHPIEPWRFTVWLVRWLVFRLMFKSGVVKLASHDPTWCELERTRFSL